jgi:hypothetical protein
MPLTPDERIETLDDSLFAAVRTETSADDRLALLVLQRAIRHRGPYAYLEIGSHLGGTIQPHYVDPRCRVIYSIDKRPAVQPDERGRIFEYPDNSSERMRQALAAAFPGIGAPTLVVFDRDASEVRSDEIAARPALCLIDGEHTNEAVESDFEACLRLAGEHAVVAFHDACYIFEGIGRIERRLAAAAIPFRGYMLSGTVYAMCLGDAAGEMADRLAPHARDERAAFRAFRRRLKWERLVSAIARRPVLWGWLKRLKRLAAGGPTSPASRSAGR